MGTGNGLGTANARPPWPTRIAKTGACTHFPVKALRNACPSLSRYARTDATIVSISDVADTVGNSGPGDFNVANRIQSTIVPEPGMPALFATLAGVPALGRQPSMDRSAVPSRRQGPFRTGDSSACSGLQPSSSAALSNGPRSASSMHLSKTRSIPSSCLSSPIAALTAGSSASSFSSRSET
jgi:hypothetical protein